MLVTSVTLLAGGLVSIAYFSAARAAAPNTHATVSAPPANSGQSAQSAHTPAPSDAPDPSGAGGNLGPVAAVPPSELAGVDIDCPLNGDLCYDPVSGAIILGTPSGWNTTMSCTWSDEGPAADRAVETYHCQ